jgi:ABC-type multidrug transport system permease subunit
MMVKTMADEDEELAQLKALYDELWNDAKSMIRDMNRSIFNYFFAGLIVLAFSTIIIGTAVSDWNKILSNGASSLTYFYAIVEVPGAIFMIIFGITLLYWYRKLKKRYSKLIEMEKKIDD